MPDRFDDAPRRLAPHLTAWRCDGRKARLDHLRNGDAVKADNADIVRNTAAKAPQRPHHRQPQHVVRGKQRAHLRVIAEKNGQPLFELFRLIIHLQKNRFRLSR